MSGPTICEDIIATNIADEPCIDNRATPIFALVVPTLNAGQELDAWHESLQKQIVSPDRTLLIDSSSDDNTVSKALSNGYEVKIIPRSQFNHGGTRQQAIDALSESDVVVFLTQDATLANPSSLANLLQPFSDPKVAAAYGRQLPRADANSVEAHARLFNYPEQSHRCSCASIGAMGIKTSFISNSFAAWRRSTLLEVGGFPSHTIQNEDTHTASRLLLAGYQIAYCADAMVYHSHRYGVAAEFRRYFDIGVFHTREPWIRKAFGQARGEGLRFVRSELRYLLRTNPNLLGSALVRTGAKLLGYKLGNCEGKLPAILKRWFSANRGYWSERDTK